MRRGGRQVLWVCEALEKGKSKVSERALKGLYNVEAGKKGERAAPLSSRLKLSNSQGLWPINLYKKTCSSISLFAGNLYMFQGD